MICNLCKLDEHTRLVPFMGNIIEMDKHLKQAHGVAHGILGWGKERVKAPD